VQIIHLFPPLHPINYANYPYYKNKKGMGAAFLFGTATCIALATWNIVPVLAAAVGTKIFAVVTLAHLLFAKRSFLQTLPNEIQDEIYAQLSPGDCIKLGSINPHFHHLGPCRISR